MSNVEMDKKQFIENEDLFPGILEIKRGERIAIYHFSHIKDELYHRFNSSDSIESDSERDCPRCNGTGKAETVGNHLEFFHKCKWCNGTGKITVKLDKEGQLNRTSGQLEKLSKLSDEELEEKVESLEKHRSRP